MTEAADAATAAIEATETVGRWLRLDPGDPACSDARDAVAALGDDVQRESGRITAALHVPLADSTEHSSDAGHIARTLADLRREIDALDPAQLDERPSMFARTLALLPGVGTPARRYVQRLTSSRGRIDEIVTALGAGRGVLSRDNITLRSDQDRLHELSASLTGEIDVAQALDDALVFAIDIELPFGDLRRPFFEDDLLVAVRRRAADLRHALAMSRQGLVAIELVMSTNRELIRGIDRTCELTLGALTLAASAAANPTVDQVVLDQIDTSDSTTSDLVDRSAAGMQTHGSDSDRQRTDATTKLGALRSAFVDIDSALADITARREEASATMERTVREIAVSEGGAAALTEKEEETR